MKKGNQILNIIISTCVGIFVGHSAWVFMDYRKYPELYAAQSAPWYTSILVWGIGLFAIAAVAVLVKIILRKKP